MRTANYTVTTRIEMIKEMQAETEALIEVFENDRKKYFNEYVGFSAPTMEREECQTYLFFLDGEIQGLKFTLEMLEKRLTKKVVAQLV